MLHGFRRQLSLSAEFGQSLFDETGSNDQAGAGFPDSAGVRDCDRGVALRDRVGTECLGPAGAGPTIVAVRLSGRHGGADRWRHLARRSPAGSTQDPGSQKQVGNTE